MGLTKKWIIISQYSNQYFTHSTINATHYWDLFLSILFFQLRHLLYHRITAMATLSQRHFTVSTYSWTFLLHLTVDHSCHYYALGTISVQFDLSPPKGKVTNPEASVELGRFYRYTQIILQCDEGIGALPIFSNMLQRLEYIPRVYHSTTQPSYQRTMTIFQPPPQRYKQFSNLQIFLYFFAEETGFEPVRR